MLMLYSTLECIISASWPTKEVFWYYWKSIKFWDIDEKRQGKSEWERFGWLWVIDSEALGIAINYEEFS
jgi:hypothetical protein